MFDSLPLTLACCPIQISLFTVGSGPYLSGGSIFVLEVPSGENSALLLLWRLYALCYKFAGTFQNALRASITQSPPSCWITARYACRFAKAEAAAGVEKVGRAWARVQRGADTGSARWMGSLWGRRSLPPDRRLPTGCALETQSPVTQESWDRLSGWRADRELLILSQPNLRGPLLIQVWNLVNFLENVKTVFLGAASQAFSWLFRFFSWQWKCWKILHFSRTMMKIQRKILEVRNMSPLRDQVHFFSIILYRFPFKSLKTLPMNKSGKK